MSGGLLALLDDVAAIAKVAAASVDDVAAQATKVGAKAVGIVIDDTAVTPRYVVGFAAERELPIIAKIAIGSLRNKLLILLPGALLLSAVAPWALTPLLMAGGAYLGFEGVEKLWSMVGGHGHDEVSGATLSGSEAAQTPDQLENAKVAGAIRTDFILSAEIMAMSLAAVAGSSFATQAVVLGLVGLGITALVYGVVALIVKADDTGVALARRGGWSRTVGLAIVRAMPGLLKALSLIGTLAMLWVGGGIIVHGLAHYGLSGVEHAIEAVGAALGGGIPGWLAGAALNGMVGGGAGLVVLAAMSAAFGLRAKTRG